jgi:uncharacterized protein (TIGR02597 family)
MTHTSICTRSIAAAIALTFAAVLSTATAQTTATTIPVGFITKTIPAAGASPSNTVLSIPLYQTAAFQSAVTATPAPGATEVTLNSAAFTTTQFTTVPHLLRVKTGALAGKFWVVLATPAPGNVVSLKEPNGGTPGVADAVLTGLVAGDSCEILPANTFGSTFGAIPGIGAGTTAGGVAVDNVLVWNGTTYSTYYYHSTNNRWQRATLNATNTIIFPDDAVFFVRKLATALPVTLMGTVPSTAEKTELIGSSNNFISNRFPVDITLGTSGIENAPGWIKGTTAGASDNVLIWNGANFTTYYYHSTNNRWQRSTLNATATPLPAAEGFFVVRSAGTSDTVLTQNLPYTP